MRILHLYLDTFWETEGRDAFGGGSFDGRGRWTRFSGILVYVKIMRDSSNTNDYDPLLYRLKSEEE